MSGGFFGSAAVTGGVVVGNLLARGSFFGPIFIPTAVAPGNQLVVSIIAAANSNGPYTSPPNPGNSYEFGAGNSTGSINGGVPCFVNGSQVFLMGQYFNGGDGRHYNILAVLGLVAQALFINMTFDDGTGFLYNLTSASASFNAPLSGVADGFTSWEWLVPVGHEFAPLNLPYTINW